MQTIIQVYCKGSTSLRKKITEDETKSEYDFIVQRERKKGKSKGWLKLKNKGTNGTLNIEWFPDAKLLTVRVINRAGGKPAPIISAFVQYLMETFNDEIKALHIIKVD